MSIRLLKTSLDLAETPKITIERNGNSDVKRILIKVSKKNVVKNKVTQEKKKYQVTRIKLEKTGQIINILRRPCLDLEVIDTILDRDNKPKVKEFILVKEPEGTAFTEEDFVNFEKCLKNEG